MRHTKHRNRGFTLVEFALASLAGMIMLGAAFTLMNTIFRSGANMNLVMQTQQNLRVAMNTITREITMAGTGLPTGGIAVPNGTNSVPLSRPGAGGTLTTPNNAIAVVAPGDIAGPTLNGAATDAITVAAINQDSPTWTVQTFNSDATDLLFVQEVRSGPNQLFPGDLLVFSNASGSVFGCVTGVSTTASRAFFAAMDAMNVNQPTAASGNLASIRVGGDGVTTATRMNIVTYYIDTSTATHPKLMRATNALAPQVIAEDVENLQFTFDLFDFALNTETSNQTNTIEPNQIRAVNISITGRSPSVMRSTLKYYRFSLVSKVNVRNNTFRNRYVGS
jgi:Tfp pilus assembly protein PilW